MQAVQTSAARPLTLEEVKTRLSDYEFYHIIEVAPGLFTDGWTAPIGSQLPVAAAIRAAGLDGRRVLDVGCRDGLFCFQAERQGASYVLGIDNDVSLGATELLIPWFGSKVQMRAANILDFIVPPDERFDLVIFAGVLYHLRCPFLGLKRVADCVKPGGQVVLETAILLGRDGEPLLLCPGTEGNPYDDPTSVTYFNHEALVAALRSHGFENVRCVAVLLDGAPVFGTYEGFKHTAWADYRGIGRATFVAEMQHEKSEADRLRDRYWYGAHSVNSDSTRHSVLRAGLAA